MFLAKLNTLDMFSYDRKERSIWMSRALNTQHIFDIPRVPPGRCPLESAFRYLARCALPFVFQFLARPELPFVFAHVSFPFFSFDIFSFFFIRYSFKYVDSSASLELVSDV